MCIRDRGYADITKLPQGLYLVVQTEASHGYEAIKPFLVSIPMPDGDKMCIRDRRTALYAELNRVLGHSDYTVTDGYHPKTDDGTGNSVSYTHLGGVSRMGSKVYSDEYRVYFKLPEGK